MGKLKQYHSGSWETRAQGSGGGSGGSSFDTDFSIRLSSDQTIDNLTTTKVSNFDTIVRDANSEWDAVNLYWVCADAGTYVINASVFWAASTIGYRAIYVYVDGVAVQTRSTGGWAVATNSSITHSVALTAGQYVEIYVRHSKGGPWDILSTSADAGYYGWEIWRVK